MSAISELATTPHVYDESGPPEPAWVPLLANLMLEDREDKGETEDGSLRRARRYTRFLEFVTPAGPRYHEHDALTCAEETAIRQWPANLGFHLGQASVFVAGQGKGKTNAVSFLIGKALAHRPDWDVYTNVPYPWDPRAPLAGVVPSPPNLHHVDDMVGLLRGVATTILAGRKPAVAIDETDQAVTSHEWSTDRAESWTRFLFVERHFRVRGPLLVYHYFESVPLPLRRSGDLRGSYFRVVVRGGERRLARVEDTSQWWVVGESALPFLTLGWGGFDINVDMADLEKRLAGGHKQVAETVLEYLVELEETRAEEAEVAAAEARLAHAEALAASHRGLAERHDAHEARYEEIVQAFATDPKLTIRAAAERFHTSHTTAVDLKAVARRRRERTAESLLPVTGVRP